MQEFIDWFSNSGFMHSNTVFWVVIAVVLTGSFLKVYHENNPEKFNEAFGFHFPKLCRIAFAVIFGYAFFNLAEHDQRVIFQCVCSYAAWRYIVQVAKSDA